MTEKVMGEIYLEPEEEIIKNAKEIAEESKNAEKHIFCIIYEAAEKRVVLSEIKRLECEIIEQSDSKSSVTLRASMSQLAAIKSLNCIEKVKIADDTSVETTEVTSENTVDTVTEDSAFTEHMSLTAMEEGEISPMCYDEEFGSDCDNSNTMQTAIYLPIATSVNGSICCPGTEIWYRFTAHVSNATEYTIYTSGSLDTIGYLYNSNGTLITSNDDGGGNLNFSITESLTYGAIYYVKVMAYGSNTGEYDVRVSYTTQSTDSGSESDGSNNQSTAIQLSLNNWKNGEICCPGTEIWYRFTADVSNAIEYIIYTSGSLDTMGYLYNSNGTLITSNDDGCENLNFCITEQLTYGATYYVKVMAYGSDTGEYDIRVSYTTQSSGGGSDSDCSNDQSTAIQLSLNNWQNGEICCLGAEKWYKFIPSTTAYYTIYTVGTLDTVGYLYDCNGNQINSDDDANSDLNFKMVHRLNANQTYYIKVEAYGSNTGYFSITVINTVFVESVTIDDTYVTLNKGETLTLSATVLPSYATNKTLRWESSNTSVVTVNSSTGKLMAVNHGSACVCAYSQDGSGKSNCCEVVVNVPVESVTINTSSLLMRVGEYDYLSAEVCPIDRVNKLIRWTSTNTSVVWVNEATGKIEARSVGSATIYATAQDGTGVRGSCVVQVEPPIAVQGIDICCDNYTMNVGDATYLSYDIYPYDATNQNVTWCSSNPSVAEVNYSTGEITAKLAGITIITATTDDGCFVASCTVKVNYCGGSDYRNVTKHNMVLQNDGYYVCTRCGYRVKSPELEDKDILSTDDYLKIIATIHYYTQCKLLAEKNSLTSAYYNLQADNAQLLIDTMRSQSNYASRYSYVNSSGVYHCNSTNNNTLSLIDVGDINLLNIGVYNGVYESISSAVLAYYCPQVAALVDVLNLVTGQMNALDFGAFVAGMYEDVSENMARYSKALSIASTVLGMVTSEVCLEDKVVRINLDFRTSAHYIFDKNNKIKAVRIFYP